MSMGALWSGCVSENDNCPPPCGQYLLARTADTLLADFADVLVACLVGFALLVRLFRQLHHDKLSVSTIFSVQFHYSMGGSSGTGEKIKDNIIIFGI